MSGFFRRSLMRKLVLFFLLVAIVPQGVSGYLAFRNARESVEEAEFAKVDLLWDAKRQQLLAAFHATVDDISLLASTRAVRVGLPVLTETKAETDRGQEHVAALSHIFDSFFELNPAEEGFEDLLLIDGKTGKVVYTQKKSSDFHADLKTGDLKSTELAKTWDQVARHQKPVISDVGIYPPVGKPSLFIGAPVFNAQTRQLVGVLAVRLNSNRVNRVMTLSGASGRTTEIYVVGKDRMMRSQTRFQKDDSVLKLGVDTEPVKRGLEGKQGRVIAKDYRGEENLSYFGLLGLNKQTEFLTDFDWVLVSELDVDEAMAPVQSLAHRVVLIAVVASVLVALVGVLLARGIARPIAEMAGIAGRISKGDLTVDVPQLKRTDEIGALATSFRLMTETLNRQIRRILEGVNVLTSAASEIGATVAQVAASTSQTSAAVTETMTTVEEVKQSARLASDKAKTVADEAHEAVRVAEVGRKATEDTALKMGLIREQMESIGETVVRLSQHSQAIEEIIGSVQDLADQSNLLAVNASIEAARAGEQGKGFGVVAQEIKSLSDQSKTATQQVRTILEETRKWVSAVVMATEQGSKAVLAGVDQSVNAGQAIGALSSSVMKSSQSASVIRSSGEQQFAGFDQVASAMFSIEQAMRQIGDGTGQMQMAAQRLTELGGNLQELVQQYRI